MIFDNLKNTNFDFMGKRKLALIFSSILILISLSSLAFRGLNLGLDFTGGTLIEIGYPETVDITVLRDKLKKGGFASASVQNFGTSKDVLIRLAPKKGVSEADLSSKVLTVVNQDVAVEGEIRRIEFVGSQVGDELTQDGSLALLYALFGILIYVAWRFEYKFSLGSVVALIHDVIITLGFFSVFGFEFDLTVIAALLAVIGYSLNDTIVVFDRIRENFRKMRKDNPLNTMNVSINQTLSRTLMTSFTTILVVAALAVLGGEIIHNFAIALLVGVLIGTYSSIFVASAATLALGVSKEDLMLPEKEGAEIDNRP
ncbi:MAG: protein translocase subunit SecF [Methylococcaceae bacterium]